MFIFLAEGMAVGGDNNFSHANKYVHLSSAHCFNMAQVLPDMCKLFFLLLLSRTENGPILFDTHFPPTISLKHCTIFNSYHHSFSHRPKNSNSNRNNNYNKICTFTSSSSSSNSFYFPFLIFLFDRFFLLCFA